jgi:endothelin-converting enzyme/putative endopeptidase
VETEGDGIRGKNCRQDQAWRSKIREDALRERLLSDPHSPPEQRVNGIVRNVDAWYKAFDVKPGDKLYLPPEERVRIW